MTKQEEIREGVYKILKRHVKASIIQGEYLDGCTQLASDEIVQYLHSQGVVIKLKCPDCVWSQFADGGAIGMTPCYCCNSTGYTTEPLIKESDD